MPYRACVRHDSGAPSPFASGSIRSAETRTPSRTSSLVTDALRLILRSTGFAVKPAVSVGTRKPRTSPSSSLAQTSAMSAIPPLLIHILVPFRTYESPSLRARVAIAATSEPPSGSVRPKQPTVSPLASPGRNRARCSSLPYRWMGYMTRELWTLTKLRSPESIRSSSYMTSPYATLLIASPSWTPGKVDSEQPHLGKPRHEVRGERALLPPPAYVRERLDLEE